MLRGAMGRGGDTAIRVRGSEFKLAPRRFGTGCRGAGEGLQVIEKSGRRGRGEYLADVCPVWRGRAASSTKGVDVTRGRGGDAAIHVRGRVRRSEFKLVSEQGAARGRGCR